MEISAGKEKEEKELDVLARIKKDFSCDSEVLRFILTQILGDRRIFVYSLSSDQDLVSSAGEVRSAESWNADEKKSGDRPDPLFKEVGLRKLGGQIAR